MPEDAKPAEQFLEKEDWAEIVRRSLLGAQHLKDIEAQARELAKKGSDFTPPSHRPPGPK
jgi:hypothetical protein